MIKKIDFPQSQINLWDKLPKENVKFIVLHHLDAVKAMPHDVDTWHKERWGESGYGYNAQVQKVGDIYIGRGVGRQGAHVYGYNEVSYGISAEGNYDLEKTMPWAQLQGMKSAVSMVEFAFPNLLAIVPHSWLYPTSCAGRYFPLSEFIPTLMIGSKCESVKRLQRILKLNGFDPGAIDGDFGSGTKAAVMAFQKKRKLSVDGIVGLMTHRSLVEGVK